MPRAIRRTGMLAVLAANAVLSGPAVAHESASNTEITVTGRAESLVGISTSASLGRVGQVELRHIVSVRAARRMAPSMIAPEE